MSRVASGGWSALRMPDLRATYVTLPVRRCRKLFRYVRMFYLYFLPMNISSGWCWDRIYDANESVWIRIKTANSAHKKRLSTSGAGQQKED